MKKILVLTAGVALSIGLSISFSAQIPAGTPGEGALSDWNNLVVVDAGDNPGEVKVGAEINGTLAHVVVSNLTSEQELTLHSPQETWSSVVAPNEGIAVFKSAPLLNEGTWKVKDSNENPVTSFETSFESGADILTGATIALDIPIKNMPARDTTVGMMEATPTRVNTECLVSAYDTKQNGALLYGMHGDWKANTLEEDVEIIFIVITETFSSEPGEYQKQGTAQIVTEGGQGTVTVYGEWIPGHTYYTELFTLLLDGDGDLRNASTVEGCASDGGVTIGDVGDDEERGFSPAIVPS